MGMSQQQFTNYYLAATRVGSQSDLDYFYKAWYQVYGYLFKDSTPWNSTSPEYRVPKIVPKVRTKMLSIGCSATDADRVLKSFKKWYKDSYE